MRLAVELHLAAIVLAAPSSLKDICGWPSLAPGGLFGPPTVRLAQRMLGYALGDPYAVADGNFTSATVAAIEQFQKMANISANVSTPGHLNAGTWPKLVDACLTAPLAESSQLIEAAQDALTFNGFAAPVTGHLDAQTVQALSAFQQARGASEQPPGSADAATWHLLATGCQSGADGGHFWFDAGWPQGNMSVESLSCMREHGFEFATFECWVESSGHAGKFWSGCPQNIANAHAAGFARVGAYMYPGRNGDPTEQTRWLLGNLSEHSVDFEAVMLDVEGGDWAQHSHEENRAFMLAIKIVPLMIVAIQSVLEQAGVRYTVYSGRSWPTYFGDTFTAFKDAPLIYAHYDLVPSFYDAVAAPMYGGWEGYVGKQFWDGQGAEYQLCGTGALDWDWSPKPYW